MRQLATLPSNAAARTLADYLLTLHIQTQLLPEDGGWAVWVCDEDRLPQARQEFAEFQRNPSDPRFLRAAAPAEALRQKERLAEVAYHRRNERMSRGWARMTGGRHPLTTALIAACVVVCLATRGGSFRYGLLGDLLITPIVVDPERGPGLADHLTAVEQGQVWRLVTPIFIHFGPWHLLFNMVMLYRLGGAVESRRRGGRYLLLLLAFAVASNLAQYWLGDLRYDGSLYWQPSAPFGGMSGVLYGLLGYVWMKARFEPELGLRIDPSTVTWLMIWFFLCASREFQAFIGPVANMAHAGGLVSGILIGVAPPLARGLWRHMRGG
jgi:GlpG protein